MALKINSTAGFLEGPPPSTKKGSQKFADEWVAMRAQLKAAPNRWAVVGTGSRTSDGGNVGKALGEGFEVTSRKAEGGITIYARYVNGTAPQS